MGLDLEIVQRFLKRLVISTTSNRPLVNLPEKRWTMCALTQTCLCGNTADSEPTTAQY